MRQSIEAVNDAIWLFTVDGISLNLSQEEKRRIEGSFDNRWLSDTIIDVNIVDLKWYHFFVVVFSPRTMNWSVNGMVRE